MRESPCDGSRVWSTRQTRRVLFVGEGSSDPRVASRPVAQSWSFIHHVLIQVVSCLKSVRQSPCRLQQLSQIGCFLLLAMYYERPKMTPGEVSRFQRSTPSRALGTWKTCGVCPSRTSQTRIDAPAVALCIRRSAHQIGGVARGYLDEPSSSSV